MITQLSRIFGSKTKAQEILLLQHNTKDVVRQGFYDSELPTVQRYCQENNLHIEISKFKVLLADDTNFSNKGIRIPETDKRPGMYLVYISKDQEKTLLAAYYELMNNHKALGELLGYPDCCTDFFQQHFSAHNPNPQLAPTNAFTNITKRDQDYVIISHFPCSSDCEKSIQLAKQYLDTLIKIDEKRVEELINTLKIH